MPQCQWPGCHIVFDSDTKRYCGAEHKRAALADRKRKGRAKYLAKLRSESRKHNICIHPGCDGSCQPKRGRPVRQVRAVRRTAAPVNSDVVLEDAARTIL
jgi:hypothetical protein